jgi:hypothetical protein
MQKKLKGKFQSEILDGRRSLQDLGVNGIIIFNWALRKYGITLVQDTSGSG